MQHSKLSSHVSSMAIIRKRIFLLLTSPPALAFVPAFSLAAFWFGGEGALLVVAALIPVIYLLFGGVGAAVDHLHSSIITRHGLLRRGPMAERCEAVFTEATETGLNSCIHVIEIEKFAELVDQYGPAAGDTIIQRIGERLSSTMRDDDAIGQIGDARFAVCAHPSDSSHSSCVSNWQAGFKVPQKKQYRLMEPSFMWTFASVFASNPARPKTKEATGWKPPALPCGAHRRGARPVFAPTPIRCIRNGRRDAP